MITSLILAAIIVIIIVTVIIDQLRSSKEYEERLLKAYLEYCESMKGEDTVKSFAEFKLDIVNLRKKNLEIIKQQNQIRLSNIERDGNEKSASHIPKCPTCGSTRIEKIPVAVKIFFLGPFAPLYKTFKCKKCEYKW